MRPSGQPSSMEDQSSQSRSTRRPSDQRLCDFDMAMTQTGGSPHHSTGDVPHPMYRLSRVKWWGYWRVVDNKSSIHRLPVQAPGATGVTISGWQTCRRGSSKWRPGVRAGPLLRLLWTNETPDARRPSGVGRSVSRSACRFGGPAGGRTRTGRGPSSRSGRTR